jgi:hypothetical protein
VVGRHRAVVLELHITADLLLPRRVVQLRGLGQSASPAALLQVGHHTAVLQVAGLLQEQHPELREHLQDP